MGIGPSVTYGKLVCNNCVRLLPELDPFAEELRKDCPLVENGPLNTNPIQKKYLKRLEVRTHKLHRYHYIKVMLPDLLNVGPILYHWGYK